MGPNRYIYIFIRMPVNVIYLRLSNFSDDTIKYILKKTGYKSILDFELNNNVCFELIIDNNILVERQNNNYLKSNCDYYLTSVPLSSLNCDVKQYLYLETNIKLNYTNFEHYFNENYKILSPIKMFIPIKKEIEGFFRNNNINTHTNLPIDISTNHDNSNLNTYTTLNTETNLTIEL